MPVRRCAINPSLLRARPFARRAAGAALLALPVLLSGCEGVQPQTTLSPRSDVGWDIQNLFMFIVVAAAVVFVIVEGVLVYAVLRYRRRPDYIPGPPVGRHGNTRLEIGWTLLPVLVLAVIAVPTVGTIFATAAPAPRNAVQVQVTGHQWWWEFRYPGLRIVTANELHLPVGRTANLSLTSADVIHSFWVPTLDGKRDLFPNHVNNLWFTPSAVGNYPAQCAEFCGESHGYMQMRVVVQTTADFDAWVRDQQGVGAAVATGEAHQGAMLFAQGTCAGCHAIAGTTAVGNIGPNLTHVASRSAIGGQLLANTPANLALWIANSPSIKPGSHMPPQALSARDLASIVAYLRSLK